VLYTTDGTDFQQLGTGKFELEHWGVYTGVYYQDSGNWTLFHHTDIDSDYFWWPLITLGLIFLLVIGCRIGWILYNKKKEKKAEFEDLEKKFLNNDVENQAGQPVKEVKPVQLKERLQC